MKRHKMSSGILSVFLNTIMMLFCISCIFPFIWIVYSSLKTKQEFSLSIISLPLKPVFSNYLFAITKGKMLSFFINSAYNSVISVAMILLISFIIGYLLARIEFKGRFFLYTLFMFGMLIPEHSLLVPLFIMYKNIGFLDKIYSLIFPYIAFGLPMSVFLIESFVRMVPRELEEAAHVDGSSFVHTMFSIIMPICKPVISTALILSFLGAWNEFSFALVLIRSDKWKTIPIGLTNFFGAHTTDYTELMAALVIASLPVIIIYAVFYKDIIKGMVAGAVKG